MPKTKAQKQEMARELADALERQHALVFVDYSGLNVKNMAQLRNQLKDTDAQLKVTKKTLLKRVLAEKEIPAEVDGLLGQLGLVFAFGDPVAAIKQVQTFAKTNESLKILGGTMENRFLDQAQVVQIAQLPPRETLLGQLVGTVAAPVSGLLQVMQGNVKGLLFALTAIQERKA